MSQAGIEPGPPAWEVSTLEGAIQIAFRNLYIWARDMGNFFCLLADSDHYRQHLFLLLPQLMYGMFCA